jgi:hypothetical protein
VADIVAKRFFASPRATLTQEVGPSRKTDSKGVPVGFESCSLGGARRLLHCRSKILWALDAILEQVCEGTSSHIDELIGDFGNKAEAILIGDHGLFCLLAEHLSHHDLRLLQQYRPIASFRCAAKFVAYRTNNGHRSVLTLDGYAANDP